MTLIIHCHQVSDACLETTSRHARELQRLNQCGIYATAWYLAFTHMKQVR